MWLALGAAAVQVDAGCVIGSAATFVWLQVLLILTQRDFGPMFKAERRSHREGKLYADNADKEAVRTSHRAALISSAQS